MDYSKTVNLPKTAFSMKANLREKEPQTLKLWLEQDIYAKILESRKGSPSYILHDGPPYANGEIHIGHALNKVLKDIIVKYRTMKGALSPYVPGWDCHGLPIEHQVVKEMREKKKEYTTDILRKACRSYAAKFVEKQKKDFQRLGIFGEWSNPYLTMSPDYEADIVSAFGDLVKEGYVYRGLKPVYWCSSCETALAEAEVEYHDHSTPAVYVKFPVKGKTVKGLPLSVLIWTTTPWTLPANLAVCFHPKHRYLCVKPGGKAEYWVMVNELVEPSLAKFGLTVEDSVPIGADELEHLACAHPFIDRDSRAVFDEYVTVDTGTGVVHIAPGHGEEDFLIGRRYGLPVLSPVDDQGRFTAEFEPMKGTNVFDANEKIIGLLREKGNLVHSETLNHSYPHCWRSKNPVIFRATNQWFLNVNHKDLAKRCLDAIRSVNWVPGWGLDRMNNMIDKRPDWCLSRQRAWGVPIPAFYCSCGATVMDEKTIGHFSLLSRERNIDIWFTSPASELLPPGTKCPKCGNADASTFAKGRDILDVWFDSGISQFAVLEKRQGLSHPADLYLEGNDQYRGWFQSSLIPSMALRGRPPFRTVLTHGMTLDEKGYAMHKSAGNAIAPNSVWDEYGADIIRLWVVSSDYREDIALGPELLKRLAESYRMLRNTARFLLGNLNGFDTSKDLLPADQMLELDLWALTRLSGVISRVGKAYEKFEFHVVFHELNNYCSTELSAAYFSMLKDRLYTAKASSIPARSARTALTRILEALTRLLAPILSFTTEEIWSVYRTELKARVKASVHLEDFPDPPAEAASDRAKSSYEKWERILATREQVKKALETLRGAKVIGDGLEAKVTVGASDAATAALLKDYAPSLPMAYIVSQVRVVEPASIPEPTVSESGITVRAEKADGAKCVRCWNWSAKVGSDAAHPELCDRCVEALS
jgi:isoleucyl-tRNA synthetase